MFLLVLIINYNFIIISLAAYCLAGLMQQAGHDLETPVQEQWQRSRKKAIWYSYKRNRTTAWENYWRDNTTDVTELQTRQYHRRDRTIVEIEPQAQYKRRWDGASERERATDKTDVNIRYKTNQTNRYDRNSGVTKLRKWQNYRRDRSMSKTEMETL